jgi:SEC-C motif
VQMQNFTAQLREQLDFMHSSAAAYDAGNEAEAKRLALHLRILLHDTRRSVGLLTHLRVRDDVPYVDTAIAPMPELPYDFALGLCRLQGDGMGPDLRWRYAAPLDDLGEHRHQPPSCFQDWWTDGVLVDRRGEANEFSRRSIVLAVANQDGGAHVDAKLNRSYERLTRWNSMGIDQFKGGIGFTFGAAGGPGSGKPPDGNLALASIRQIAHEVQLTLQRSLRIEGGGCSVIDPICRGSRHVQFTAGRNDLCPCGSGRKAKRCYLARLPRRSRTLTSGRAAMT